MMRCTGRRRRTDPYETAGFSIFVRTNTDTSETMVPPPRIPATHGCRRYAAMTAEQRPHTPRIMPKHWPRRCSRIMPSKARTFTSCRCACSTSAIRKMRSAAPGINWSYFSSVAGGGIGPWKLVWTSCAVLPASCFCDPMLHLELAQRHADVPAHRSPVLGNGLFGIVLRDQVTQFQRWRHQHAAYSMDKRSHALGHTLYSMTQDGTVNP